MFLFAAEHVVKAAPQPDMLIVKRLAVVDEKGTERVVIAAPLPDPIIQGKSVKILRANLRSSARFQSSWDQRLLLLAHIRGYVDVLDRGGSALWLRGDARPARSYVSRVSLLAWDVRSSLRRSRAHRAS